LTSPNPHRHDALLDAAGIAERFVKARLTGACLSGFPGPMPADLVTGYASQKEAIRLWPDAIAGWKVGYIAPERRDDSAEDRLVGPIFSRAVQNVTTDRCVDFPVFVGGFAAVEAEFVFRLGRDAEPDKSDWTPAQAAELVSALYIGVETAGSPLATINILGPAVVVSDFGNNAGLILGPEIPGWDALDESELICETQIEGVCVGSGGAASVPGGLLAALCFALNRCARLGLPMQAGTLITTGAATGIHDIRAGQNGQVRFGRWGVISCRAVAAANGNTAR
jgi:2-keto-4-pentenoate hydratase